MNRRSGYKVVLGLIGLIQSMLPIMLLAIIMGVLGFLASIAISVLGAQALVSILDHETTQLQFVFTIIIICGIARGFLRYAEQAANHYIAFKLLAIIRDKVFRKLRQLAPAKLETKDKGNLISMLTSDVELLEVFYAHTISPVAIACIVVFIMVAYIGNIHYGLGLLAMLAYLGVGVILPLYTSKQGKAKGVVQREMFGALNSYVLECVHGVKEILQYQRGDKTIQTLSEKSSEYNKTNEQLKKVEGASRAQTDLVIMGFVLLMFISSAWLYMDGQISFGSVFIASVAMASSFGPVTALSNLANNLIITFASGERVLSLLEEEPQIVENIEGVDEPYETLDVEHVSFAYGAEQVLTDVSLSLTKNEIIGIKGKSGSGKSTLLKLLMRFFDAASGDIKMNQQALDKWKTAGLRNEVSYVTQETYLFNDSIMNNLKIANHNASVEDVIEACKKANIHDFIMSLDDQYQSEVGDRGSKLSGGQKQRLGIARAFLQNAPVVLLDEPTSNLDSLNEAIILKSLKDNAAGKTIVLVSHRASSLKIADRIIELEEH